LSSSDAISRSRAWILADDLTGACDAGSAFALRGLRTKVILKGLGHGEDFAEVCALSTGSRDLPVEEAVMRLTEIASNREITQSAFLFKKIDSVFRGNTADEIAVATRLFGACLSVVAPAYPAMGRTSVDGIIHVRDLDGQRQVRAVEAMRAAGLEATLVSAGSSLKSIADGMREVVDRHSNGVIFCDAIEQADLETTVLAAQTLHLRTLWVGSGGLAHALAEGYGRHVGQTTVASTKGTVLIFVGSGHAVSNRQVQYLREREDVVCVAPGSSRSANDAGTAAVVIPVNCGTTTEQEIVDLIPHLEPKEVSCLFMTGGDTAALVCRALGVAEIELKTEVAPGLPQGVLIGGPFSGCTVVLKSGGFGDVRTMSRVVDQFAHGERCVLE
jgi:D-threonate/D-erythronate kinase